jgi:5-methylcytosine-specific restriction endonuclease McrA
VRKMDVPAYDALSTYDTCVGAIDDLATRAPYTTNRVSIQQANSSFDTASLTAAWAGLPRAAFGNPDALIAGALSKKQLMSLYTNYMVGTTGPSREIYDKLLTAAGGLCPFCGGLGHTRTLDHYLPKAYFPAYSVHPSNLVPCCRDCNSGKNASFAIHAHEQTLHPYLDRPCFFEERWIIAVVHRENPILLRFECVPPPQWPAADKARVRSHFTAYKLAYRFSVQAGGEVSKVVQLRTSSLKNLTPESFEAFLLDNANSLDFVLNGWSRTMYTALAASDWFVNTDFNIVNWHLAT